MDSLIPVAPILEAIATGFRMAQATRTPPSRSDLELAERVLAWRYCQSPTGQLWQAVDLTRKAQSLIQDGTWGAAWDVVTNAVLAALNTP